MGTVTLDSVTYETDLLSDEGRAIVSHLVEAEKSLREASITVGLMQAATVALLSDLKSNHLTEEALSTEEVETIEE
jgi:hypothetical protein